MFITHALTQLGSIDRFDIPAICEPGVSTTKQKHGQLIVVDN